MAATYRRVNMKALARYQIILLGEQRHIGVNNLPKVVARQCISRESNPRPFERKSNALTTTPPSVSDELTWRALETRRPVIQLYTGVLTASRKPQYVVFAVVHFKLKFTDWLTRQTHIVHDVQRSVNLTSITPTASAMAVTRCKH